MVPFGKTTVLAEIIDHEQDRVISPKTVIFTYTFIYQYKDENGKLYKTRKNVSSATYDMYKDSKFIPIKYRNRFPYDTFIDNHSIREFFSPIFTVPTFIFAFIAYFIYFFIKKYIEVWGIPFMRTQE
ncbi:hypothetical protein FHP05_09050 [Cerasibacillus terrae]|uniref:DUF3592 domain-containing protein n=1 Tax=Cerasibacillus terrae TaxID=2498845 RepID=A0A5C8NTQ8_9BACI|nr:hypothetical protein [Cerasibacillus terrae]TXL64457.1 hypothetical protein FHP05_09050 [Cerasibacillus terrae]